MTRFARAGFAAALCAAMLLPGAAEAYTGPGIGLGALGVAFGVLGSLFLGILAVIWYPIKRLFRAFRSKPKDSNAADELPPE